MIPSPLDTLLDHPHGPVSQPIEIPMPGLATPFRGGGERMPPFGILLRLYLPIAAGVLAGVGLGYALAQLQRGREPSQRL